MTLYTILLILGSICLLAALVMVIKPWIVAAIPAYAGLWLLHLSVYTTFPKWIFIFYGFATAMVVGLKYISPKGEPDGRNTGNLYIGLGSMMGCLLGMLVDARFMLLGTILGAVMGQLAFSRTPHGKWLMLSKTNFIQYLCAKGLPAVVAVAMIGVGIEGFVYDIANVRPIYL
ncbi:MAG: hypothetical protein IKW83_08325 [Muribaculaceae bacterium]|nr:hypothetical protein [Muribaculaceae bacterium]